MSSGFAFYDLLWLFLLWLQEIHWTNNVSKFYRRLSLVGRFVIIVYEFVDHERCTAGSNLWLWLIHALIRRRQPLCFISFFYDLQLRQLKPISLDYVTEKMNAMAERSPVSTCLPESGRSFYRFCFIDKVSPCRQCLLPKSWEAVVCPLQTETSRLPSCSPATFFMQTRKIYINKSRVIFCSGNMKRMNDNFMCFSFLFG